MKTNQSLVRQLLSGSVSLRVDDLSFSRGVSFPEVHLDNDGDENMEMDEEAVWASGSGTTRPRLVFAPSTICGGLPAASALQVTR